MPDRSLQPENYVQIILNLLASPLGVAGVLCTLALLAVVSVHRGSRWWVLAGLILLSSFGISNRPWFDNTLATPLEQIRSVARPATFVLLLVLLLPTAQSPRGWRRQIVPGMAICFLLLEMVFSFRLLLGGGFSRGGLGLVSYALVFVALAVGVGRWLQTADDALAAMRAIGGAGLLFALATAYQLFANSSAVVWSGRLFAITGNPQHAAVAISTFMVPLAFLLTYRGERFALRLLWGGTLAFMSLFLIYTGSRTGLAMTVIGLTALFRLKMGRALVTVAVAGVFVLLGLQFFAESQNNWDRLLSTSDTRTANWKSMLGEFLANPLFGSVGDEGPAITENSYLSVAGRMGVVGLLPMFAMLLAAGVTLVRLLRYRRRLGPDGIFVDLVAAGMISLLVGANFEGYLLSTFSPAVFCLYIYAAVACFMIDAITAQAAASRPAYAAEEPAVDHPPGAGVSSAY